MVVGNMPTTIVKAWHSISGTVEPATLTEEQIATHVHRSLDGGDFIVYGKNGSRDFGHTSDSVHGDDTTGATGGSQSHSHNFTGSSGNTNTLPPYYVLSMVMRIA